MAWQKGQSGNPKGRSKTQIARAAELARMIGDATDGGRALVQVFLDEIKREAHTAADHARKLHAAEVLLERFAGRALEVVDVNVTTDGDRPALSDLSAEALAAIERVIATHAPDDDAMTH